MLPDRTQDCQAWNSLQFRQSNSQQALSSKNVSQSSQGDVSQPNDQHLTTTDQTCANPRADGIDQLDQSSTNVDRFIAHLHRGGDHRFTQNLTGNKTITVWSHTDEPLRLPPLTGDENIFYSVNPVTTRVTDGDREKYRGKSDSYIENFVASKTQTIAALNCLYSEFDGKDQTEPTAEQIEAQYQKLRANPDKAKAHDKALRNEAAGNARSAIYKTNPQYYLSLVYDHVASLQPQPSVIVASGGGLQCFWLLDQPFILATDEDRARAIDAQKRWVQLTGGDQGVCDIRRILRLPGSINHKRAYAPNYPTVSFVKADFARLFTFDELTALLPSVEPVAPKERKASQYHSKAPTNTTAAPGNDLAPTDSDRLIDLFNEQIDIRNILRHFGYTDHGDRMSPPGDPDSRGVQHNGHNRTYHHDTNDPLYTEHLISPFDVLVAFQFDGKFSAALAALANAVYQPLIDLMHRQAPTEHRSEINDRKTVLSVIEIMQKTNRIGIQLSQRRGANLAGVSRSTWDRSLARLTEFFTVTNDQFGNYIRLNVVVFSKWATLEDLYEFSDRSGGPLTENDFFTQEKNADPFVTGISKAIRRRAQRVADALEISHKQAKQDYTLPSAGAGVLLAFDTFVRIGDMTAKEYSEATGLKLSTARAHLAKAEKMGLAESEREGARGQKTFSFIPEFWERIAELLPNMRTYTTGSQRENVRLERSQIWVQRGLSQCKDDEQKSRLERRFAKLAEARLPHLRAIYADLKLTEHQITELAYRVLDTKRTETQAEQIKAEQANQRIEHRENVALIADLAVDLLDVGSTKETVAADITKFGFDIATVKAVILSQIQLDAAGQRADQTEIERKIIGMRKAKWSEHKIRRQLIHAGWLASMVDRAMYRQIVAPVVPIAPSPQGSLFEVAL